MKKLALYLIGSVALVALGFVARGALNGKDKPPVAEGAPAPEPGIIAEPDSEAEKEPSAQTPDPATETVNKPRVKPKPLGKSVNTGLAWLIERQQNNGGWGPGHSTEVEATDVANTCIALQALGRGEHTPKSAKYSENVRRGIAYVCQEIEQSDNDSLFVTKNRQTQIQRKLGTYVDTFMAATVLPEFKNKLEDKKLDARLTAALDKVIAKMEKHQQDDGSWRNEGWAPALAQGLATKGLNRAVQNGWKVSEESRSKAERFSQAAFDSKSKSFKLDAAAGIDLYSASSNLSSLADAEVTNEAVAPQLAKAWRDETDAVKKSELKDRLDSFKVNTDAVKDQKEAVIQRISDPAFIAGFGNNGGEEFLSYMNIGESLLATGGDKWKEWDQKISTTLAQTQDPDGCWKGKHCITGGTFCTSTALLVLMTDRTPLPEASQKTVASN